MRIYNKNSGAWEEFSNEEAVKALRSGQYTVGENATMQFRDVHGEERTAKGREILDYANLEGVFPKTEVELRNEYLESEVGEPLEQIKAFGEGAIESVPFVGGLISDAVTDDDRAALRAEYYPTTKAVGEGVGLLAQIAAPYLRAAGAAGKAIQVGTAPVRGLLGASKSAGKFAEKAVKATTIGKNPLAQKVAYEALENATFGAGYTAGKIAQDLIKSDEEFTTDTLLANAEQLGSNAITDLALGGAIPVAGKAIRNTYNAIKSASKKAGKLFSKSINDDILSIEYPKRLSRYRIETNKIDDMDLGQQKFDTGYKYTSDDKELLKEAYRRKAQDEAGDRIGELGTDFANEYAPVTFKNGVYKIKQGDATTTFSEFKGDTADMLTKKDISSRNGIKQVLSEAGEDWLNLDPSDVKKLGFGRAASDAYKKEIDLAFKDSKSFYEMAEMARAQGAEIRELNEAIDLTKEFGRYKFKPDPINGYKPKGMQKYNALLDDIEALETIANSEKNALRKRSLQAQASTLKEMAGEMEEILLSDSKANYIQRMNILKQSLLENEEAMKSITSLKGAMRSDLKKRFGGKDALKIVESKPIRLLTEFNESINSVLKNADIVQTAPNKFFLTKSGIDNIDFAGVDLKTKSVKPVGKESRQVLSALGDKGSKILKVTKGKDTGFTEDLIQYIRKSLDDVAGSRALGDVVQQRTIEAVKGIERPVKKYGLADSIKKSFDYNKITPDEMSLFHKALGDSVGNELSNEVSFIANALDSQGVIFSRKKILKEIYDDLRNHFEINNVTTNERAKEIVKGVVSDLDDTLAGLEAARDGALSAADVWKLRSQIDNAVKWQRAAELMPISEDIAMKTRFALDNAIVEYAQRVSPSNAIKYKNLKNKYQMSYYAGKYFDDLKNVAEEKTLLDPRNLKNLKNLTSIGIGGAFGGLGGAVGGYALAQASDQILPTIKMLYKTDMAVGVMKWTDSIKKTANAMVDNKITKFTKKLPVGVYYAAFNDMDTEKELNQYVEKQREQLSHHNIIEQFAENHADLQEMYPEIFTGLTMKTEQIRQFLNSKLPIADDDMFYKRTPSKNELKKFAEYKYWVTHPSEILDSFKNGIVLNEQVEILKEIYPAIFERLAVELAASYEKGSIPYKKRVDLYRVFGVGTEPVFRGSNFMMLQGSNPQLQQEQQQGTLRKTNASFSSNAETLGQRLNE